MENFDQIFTLLAENGSIGLNLDILETGILNIAALVGILIYTGKDFLGSILQERKDTIVKSVQDAEDRLDEANRRLSEAQKQLSQAHVVISEIRNETRSAKTNLLKSDANIAKKELVVYFTISASVELMLIIFAFGKTLEKIEFNCNVSFLGPPRIILF